MNELELRLNIFKDKNIIVFGGTGTIGSLIVEYVKQFSPNVIRVFSNDENSLWESQQKWGDEGMRYLLGDIRDKDRVELALKKIDFAFNCAAIKHVPFAEYNPLEATEVNVFGLDNIIKGCVKQNVSKLLHISTDKAVEPTTVMGCSKRIGERLIQIRWSQNPTINMVCVRLGNVYGSRGSIVPIIKEKIKKGEPIQITSLEMTRFFMKPEEVTEFIMNAFINGTDGEIWVPELKSQKLTDIIREIAGQEYAYEIIGLRKCEKLREKLLFPHEFPDAIQKEGYYIIKNDYSKWI